MNITIQDKGIWIDIYIDGKWSARLGVSSYSKFELIFIAENLKNVSLQPFYNLAMIRRTEDK